MVETLCCKWLAQAGFENHKLGRKLPCAFKIEALKTRWQRATKPANDRALCPPKPLGGFQNAKRGLSFQEAANKPLEPARVQKFELRPRLAKVKVMPNHHVFGENDRIGQPIIVSAELTGPSRFFIPPDVRFG